MQLIPKFTANHGIIFIQTALIQLHVGNLNVIVIVYTIRQERINQNLQMHEIEDASYASAEY